MKYMIIVLLFFLHGLLIMGSEGLPILADEQEYKELALMQTKFFLHYNDKDALERHLKNEVGSPEQLASMPIPDSQTALQTFKDRALNAAHHLDAFNAMEMEKDRKRKIAQRFDQLINPRKRAGLIHYATSASTILLSAALSLYILTTRQPFDYWQCHGQKQWDCLEVNPKPFNCPSFPPNCCAQIQGCCQKKFDCCDDAVPRVCQNELNAAARNHTFVSLIPFFCVVLVASLAQIIFYCGATRCMPKNTAPGINQLMIEYGQALTTLTQRIDAQVKEYPQFLPEET